MKLFSSGMKARKASASRKWASQICHSHLHDLEVQNMSLPYSFYLTWSIYCEEIIRLVRRNLTIEDNLELFVEVLRWSLAHQGNTTIEI
jgi:hypothetical protein